MSTKSNILLCAHDAGGANLLYAWAMQAGRRINAYQHVLGPAASIFSDKFPSDIRVPDVDFVVTGTGWQSDFEVDCIRQAKKNRVPVVSYLDHWVNYESRFHRRGDTFLPDRIWCPDNQSLLIAQSTELFKGIPKRQVGNWYWRSVCQSMPKLSSDSILVIHEPIRDKSVDQDVLVERCIHLLKQLCNQQRIVFRVHPSGLDEFGKRLYERLSSVSTCEVSDKPLEYDLASATHVIGYLSVVLAMAASFGLRVCSVASTIPDYLTHFGVRQPVLLKSSTFPSRTR